MENEAINEIRNNNKRPSSEEIFYIKKKEINFEVEEFKKTLRKLEDDGFLKNMPRKGDRESFYIMQQIHTTSDADITGETPFINVDNLIKESQGMNIFLELSDRLDVMKKYVELEFVAIHSKLRHKEQIEDLKSNMEKEIDFLRNELRSKDAIINILLEKIVERENSHSVSQEKVLDATKSLNWNDDNNITEFQQPKKFIKQTI